MPGYFLFDERFAEAFLHKKHKVLGFTLKPFTYWHRFQLEWVNSKLLLGGATLWDVWMACKICTSAYPHQAKLPVRPSRLWRIWWNIFWGWRNEAKALKDFFAYYSDYVSTPKYWQGKGSSYKKLSEAYLSLWEITKDEAHKKKSEEWDAMSKTPSASGLDESLEAVAVYCNISKRPPIEAWNMPVGELHWMASGMQLANGAEVQIWTAMDDIRMERHQEERNKKLLEKATELQKNEPELDAALAFARASVDYWEQVIKNVDANSK